MDQTLDEPLIRGNESQQEDNLIDPDTGIPLSSIPQTPASTSETAWISPTEATTEQMKERLISCEDVFVDSIQTDMEVFENFDFDVDAKTQEISELLKSDPALQTTFSMLSDTVTYNDFWKRYFYFINDEEQLPNTYSIYYQKYLQQRADAQPSTATTAMGGITSFLR